MSDEFINDKPIDPASLHFNTDGDAPGLPAWTEVEEGRYMPRRVRGSFQGRALG